MTPRLIDISTRLSRETQVSVVSPTFAARRVLSMDRGDDCNISMIWVGSHCGTHVNAPAHVYSSGEPIDRMPLDVTVGAARVVAVLHGGPIGEREVAGWKPADRILIRTPPGGDEPPAYLTWQAAAWLAARRTLLVGIDRPSIGDECDDEMRAHRALLAGEVWIIEGLELSHVEPGVYELMCLPLKVLNGDAAPARAVLRSL